MQIRNHLRGFKTALAILTTSVVLLGAISVGQETVLYNFIKGKDGQYPTENLMLDTSGNIYGGTSMGGTYNIGAIYQLSPQAGGGWVETVIHACGNKGDGWWPSPGALIEDASGNLYGTTRYGGAYGSLGNYVGGTVYELSPQAGGVWKETILHSFGNGTDGAVPISSLVFDSVGNLYGATQGGGSFSNGTVYELSPQTGGGWSEKVLHSFGSGKDGSDPNSPKILIDAAGNLYGTTINGGGFSKGVAYELSPQTGGGWRVKILHSFGATTLDAVYPLGLVFDSTGNLYGAAALGGAYNYGTAFEMTLQSGGGWLETTIHSFGNGADGISPNGALVFDATGNLYGTTYAGGAYAAGNSLAGGTTFELTPVSGQRPWAETVLHSFGNPPDGSDPTTGVVFDVSGNLYGTTEYSGVTADFGTVYEITP